MLRLLLVWLVNALALLALPYVFPWVKVDTFTAAPFVVALCRGNLILKRAPRIHKKPADESGFAVVYAAGGDEP